MKHKSILVLAFVTIFAAIGGCRSTCPPQEPDVVYVPPLAVGDGGPSETVAEATSTCGRACATLRKLGCAEGNPTPSGSRCYDVCTSAPKLLAVECVVGANSVADLKICNVRCLR